MAKIKVSVEPGGLHRSGYHFSDDGSIFENDGPSEADFGDSLTIIEAIRTICHDTYGETYYDPPIVTTEDGVARSKDYRRGWFRGDPQDSEKELAARLVGRECKASGIYTEAERRWVKPVIFRTFEPALEIDFAVAQNGQRIEGLRIHLRNGPSAMPEILNENARRVAAEMAAGNILTEARKLEDWAYHNPHLDGRFVPSFKSIRNELHDAQVTGQKVICPRSGASA